MLRPGRVWDQMISGLAACAGVITGLVCLLIVYDVIARNLGLQPPASTVALTEYALLYLTMSAAPWLVRERGHIVAEIVYRHYPESLRRAADLIILLICCAVALLVAVLAFVLMMEALQRGEIEVRSLDTPRWVLFLPICCGFALMSIEFARLAVCGESLLPREGSKQDMA